MCKGTHDCCDGVVLEENGITTSLWVNMANQRSFYQCLPMMKYYQRTTLFRTEIDIVRHHSSDSVRASPRENGNRG